MTYMNYKTTLEWQIKTKKMKSVIRQQDNNNKYTGSRDDDSLSKNWTKQYQNHLYSVH